MADAVKSHLLKLKSVILTAWLQASHLTCLCLTCSTENTISVFILFTLSTLEARSPLLHVPGITHPYFQLWVLKYKDIGNYVGEIIKITAEKDRTEKRKLFFLLTVFNQNNFRCYLVRKSTIFAQWDLQIFSLVQTVQQSCRL